MARLSFRCDEELVQRVDDARGDVARERWLRRAVEAYVSLQGYGSPGDVVMVDESLVISHREPTPKPVSQKPRSEPQAAVGFRRGPRQDFSPRPKGKS